MLHQVIRVYSWQKFYAEMSIKTYHSITDASLATQESRGLHDDAVAFTRCACARGANEIRGKLDCG